MVRKGVGNLVTFAGSQEQREPRKFLQKCESDAAMEREMDVRKSIKGFTR